ncbi:hypothetical protein OA493_01470 [Gammaproteobacteria bacterium]|nr:hypothetical protein [Gammaproteobacteria bacterium]
MDKDDLDKKLAEHRAVPVRLDRKINARLKEDLELLDTQLIQSELQAKIDGVVGWYNEKCDEHGFPSKKIRICEMIEPIIQTDRIDHYEGSEFEESDNYNLHHSLMSAELSNDGWDSWLKEFRNIDNFKIQVTCKADKDNSELQIYYQDKFSLGCSLDAHINEDHEEVTVVRLAQRLTDSLVPHISEMMDEADKKRIEESETPSYKWGIEYLKNLLGKK